MPIAYLDVPLGSHTAEKKMLLTRIYEALSEAYPFPPDHRVFVREWAVESVSQDGKLGSEPARPVLILHAPEGVSVDAKRKMLKGVNAAVAEAYHNLPDFMIFIQEYPLELVARNGTLHSDNPERVEKQKNVYSQSRKP